jgi:hypothetical protein
MLIMNVYKNLIIVLALFPLILFGCNKKQINTPETKKVVRKLHKIKNEDIIVIKYNNGIILKWNVEKNQLIKDSNYDEILKNKKKLQAMLSSISDNEDIGVKVCTKKTSNLKKGDIAFIFLYENQKIYLFSCLKLQFDVMNENCKYPDALLDYIEKNRQKVQEQVKKCIEL